MIVVTTEQIEGSKITETLGLVKGSTIRARHMGRDIMAGLRTIVGGEIKEYTIMLAQAREEALQRMIEQAEKMFTTMTKPALSQQFFRKKSLTIPIM